MATLHVIFLIFLIGMILFVVGRWFQDYTIGILSGFVFIFLGLFILGTPSAIENISATLELMIGAINFALGAYILVVGSLRLIE